MAQALKTLLLQLAFAAAVPVFLKDGRTRIDDDDAVVAVDDDAIVLADQRAGVVHAHGRRDVEASRDDGRVRGAPAQVRHEAGEGLAAELQHIGRSDVVRDDDHAGVRIAAGGHRRGGQHRRAGQHLQYPFDHLLDIGLALAQVFVLDLTELAHQLFELRCECPLCVVAALVDQCLGHLCQQRIVQDHPMHIEEGPHLLGRIGGQFALELDQLGAHRGTGGAQALHLGIEPVLVDEVMRNVQRRTRQHMGSPDGDAARDRDAVQGERHGSGVKDVGKMRSALTRLRRSDR